jgi:hypothetical protein
LEMLPNGRPAYSEVVSVLPRQQGKTELLASVMTHRSLGFGEAQRVLYTTQTASEARKKWEDVYIPRLMNSAFRPLFTVRYRLSAEAIMWANGSSWSPGSTTAKTGGTGDTLDLGVIDEAWSREDSRTELGMRPAMMTRKKRQLWITSMVPGLTRAKSVDSAYLKAKINAGRQRVAGGLTGGSCYFEWSAPLDADPGDPTTWWGCMPALGQTVDEEAIAGDYEAMDLPDFCAEYLGWWPSEKVPQWLVISQSTWDDLLDVRSYPVGSVAMAVDIVVVDPNGPASSLIVPLQSREDVRGCPTSRPRGIEVARPNLKDTAASCARFFDQTGELQTPPDPDGPAPQRIRHIGQSELTAAVAGARKKNFGDQWRWVRTGAAVDLTPLYAATHACWGLAVYRGLDYDVLDSVI